MSYQRQLLRRTPSALRLSAVTTACLALAMSQPFGVVRIARASSADTTAHEWFQKTEQSLMDAVAKGDVQMWDRVMDPRCIVTTEEGQVRSKEQFLKEMGPLPPGLAGGIAVKELTVDAFSDFALVRYLADEWETVFGQRITTKYRATDTFRRAGSTWKMVASHVSVVTADPPPQKVATDSWPNLVGTYQLLPNGWKFHVALRDGQLYGGTDPSALKRLIPLTSNAFVREGTLGEWIFLQKPDQKASGILDFRKFEPLVWTRVSDE